MSILCQKAFTNLQQYFAQGFDPFPSLDNVSGNAHGNNTFQKGASLSGIIKECHFQAKKL